MAADEHASLPRTLGDRLVAAVRQGEGLRERKKRLMRQFISDTATRMFLERGFDEVRVAEVAAACGVSEKTVFNYFPNKEALLLDREDDLLAGIRRSLGPEAGSLSPVDAAVAMLVENAEELSQQLAAPVGGGMDLSRFVDLIERTPSLRAAQMDMMERLTSGAAEAMAARAGVNPDDPEPQIAADALVGLWRIYFQAARRYADGTRTPTEVRDLIVSDVTRAARLINTGLWSFGLAVQGTDGRRQVQTAAEAANEARKQVMVAIRQAREAWRIIKAEAHEHHHEHHQDWERAGREARRAGREDQPARRDAQRAARRAQMQAGRRTRQQAQRHAREQAQRHARQQAERQARQAERRARSADRTGADGGHGPKGVDPE